MMIIIFNNSDACMHQLNKLIDSCAGVCQKNNNAGKHHHPLHTQLQHVKTDVSDFHRHVPCCPMSATAGPRRWSLVPLIDYSSPYVCLP